MNRRRFAAPLVIATMAFLVGAPGARDNPAAAQQAPKVGANVGTPLALPTQGGWARVIMVDNRWIVLQNDSRQQFPVNLTASKVFLMRWPSTLAEVSPTGLIEAHGPTLPSNGVETDHIDIYEGADRSMVQPTGIPYMTAAQLMPLMSMPGFNSYGTFYPNFGVFPANLLNQPLPAQTRVVGNLVGVDPIRVGVAGQNVQFIVPNEAGLTVTQVTRGVPSYVEKGDLAYFVPTSASTKTLDLNLLVVYKSMPLHMFQAGGGGR